ncbi:unnamed protein product [Ambrosiozyma monospora]|uniref:Unnamed protein product n=1 Tax=Ambrosiozyma monospora TaxID=43982 RepID=A0ACB5U7Y9_AMBMO|nr:unnamed protein product [Ambrosiozyma monospora]
MTDIFFGTTTTLNRFSFLRSDVEFIKRSLAWRGPVAGNSNINGAGGSGLEGAQLVSFKRDHARQTVDPYVIKTTPHTTSTSTSSPPSEPTKAPTETHKQEERTDIKQGDEHKVKSDLNLLVLPIGSLPSWAQSTLARFGELNGYADDAMHGDCEALQKLKLIRDISEGGLSVVFLGLDEDGFDDKFITCGNSLSKDFKVLGGSKDKVEGDVDEDGDGKGKSKRQVDGYGDGFDVNSSVFEYKGYKGRPVFAVEVTDNAKLDQFLTGLSTPQNETG